MSARLVAFHTSSASRVAFAATCALTLLAPFEATEPIVRLPGQSLSTVELALVVSIAVWVVALFVSRTAPGWRTPMTAPALALLAASALAALRAPNHGANAWHMTGRFALALVVFVIAASGTTSQERVRGVILAGLGAGAIVSVLMVLEYLEVGPVLAFLDRFRPGPALVGTQVRASGPLLYPTIASMYLEIVFALGLGILVAASAASRLGAAAIFLLLAFLAEAIVLTFTRAGLLTMAASLGLLMVMRVRQAGIDRSVRTMALLGLVVAAEVVLSRPADALSLRMTTEGPDTWYRASIDAPRELAMTTGATSTVVVSLTNTGRTTWRSDAQPPFRFAYHWLEADTNRVVVWEGIRTLFDRPVPPGRSATINARVRALSTPGTYRLLWDVELQHQLWFSSEPKAVDVETRVTVSGAPTGPPEVSGIVRVPRLALRPGRLELWPMALRMFAAHPLTGVGADNFRLEYGTYARAANPDLRVHSNNMYLETLAGTGLVGAVAGLWFLRRSLRVVAAAAKNAPVLGGGVAAAALAIALHGVLDSFLSFTATYILMAITLGLAVGLSVRDGSHAHRV